MNNPSRSQMVRRSSCSRLSSCPRSRWPGLVRAAASAAGRASAPAAASAAPRAATRAAANYYGGGGQRSHFPVLRLGLGRRLRSAAASACSARSSCSWSSASPSLRSVMRAVRAQPRGRRRKRTGGGYGRRRAGRASGRAYLYRLQLALGRSARGVQERLAEFAAQGRHLHARRASASLLQQTALELLREKDAVRYAAAEARGPDEPHQRRDGDERLVARRALAISGRARARRRRPRRCVRTRPPRRARRRSSWSWSPSSSRPARRCADSRPVDAGGAGGAAVRAGRGFAGRAARASRWSGRPPSRTTR